MAETVSTLSRAAQHPYDDIPEALKRMRPVTDFYHIQDILGSRDFAMAGRDQSLPFFLKTIILAEGEEHTAKRRLLARQFRPGALLEQQTNNVNEAIRTFIGPIAARVEEGETVGVDLVDLVLRLQTLIMARFVGLQISDDTERAVNELMQRMPLINLAGALLWSRNDPITEVNKVRHALMEFNDEYVMPAIERVRASEGSEDHHSFIGTLVDAFDPAVSDGESIAREVRVFLTAGVRTSAHAVIDAVPHVLRWLRDHPEHRQKALDDSDDLLKRMVSESLRLHVPNPAIMRLALTSGSTQNGIDYEAGEYFALYTGVSHMDARVFGDRPEEFNPNRTPDEGVALWGHAFGHGHHACIGRALALGRVSPDGVARGYEGSTVSILRELLRLGLSADPGDEPVYQQDTFKEMCKLFPARIGLTEETDVPAGDGV